MTYISQGEIRPDYSLEPNMYKHGCFPHLGRKRTQRQDVEVSISSVYVENPLMVEASPF